MKNINIKIVKTDHLGSKKFLILDAVVKQNDFDDHDASGILFALEFGANNQDFIPLRCHIFPE